MCASALYFFLKKETCRYIPICKIIDFSNSKFLLWAGSFEFPTKSENYLAPFLLPL